LATRLPVLDVFDFLFEFAQAFFFMHAFRALPSQLRDFFLSRTRAAAAGGE
jgi:hypothetical protein